MISGDAAAQRWVSGLSGAGTKITEGIDNVTVAPGQKAAAQSDTWANNTVASKAKFQRNVGKVTLEDWKTAAKTKGVPRIAGGAAAAQQKMTAVLNKLLPAIDQHVKSLPPRGTFDQNVERSVQLMRKLHAQAGQFSA